MIRSVLAGLSYSFFAISGASALNCPAYPNTLTNGTNADATQVMGNFSSILNCANTSLAGTGGATFTGPIGVGITNPTYQLTMLGTGGIGLSDNGTSDTSYDSSIVHSALSPYRFLTLTSKAGTGGWLGAINFNTNYNAGAIFTAMTIRANYDGTTANVGIGTTNPTYMLHVNGSVAGQGPYNALSDGRLKRDIESLGYGLDTIMKLRPVGFNWITQDQEWKKQHQIGLIAQEVEPVVPEAVTTANDELKTKSLAYGGLVPILIKAVQDLKAANDNLRAANDRGAAQIAILTARFDAIEAAQLTKAAACAASLLR